MKGAEVSLAMIQGKRQGVLSHLLKDQAGTKSKVHQTQALSPGFASPAVLSFRRDSNPHTCGFSWKEKAASEENDRFRTYEKHPWTNLQVQGSRW